MKVYKMRAAEEQRRNEVTMKNIHRIGTVTFGVTLVAAGLLFLTHMFMPALDYTMIFRLWPCIFIMLGLEILFAGRKDDAEFKYDTPAILLMCVLMLFAMGMGVAEFFLEHCEAAFCW